jgi:uncharacterized protein
MNQYVREVKPEVLRVLKKHSNKLGIFGSFATGDVKKESDLDILIDPKKGVGLFELIRLERELGEKIGRKVDLVTYNSVNHLLKNIIFSEEVRIYGKRS